MEKSYIKDTKAKKYYFILECDMCAKEFTRTKARRICSRKRTGKDLCNSCSKSGKLNSFYGKTHTSDNKEKTSIRMKLNIGERNTFFGKHHSEETKKILSEKTKQNIENGTVDWRQPEFLAEQKKPGNPKYLRNWRSSLTAEKRKEIYGFPGETNPMFGKPSPKGSGNGWSGWYKGIFFRSLLELGFMLENPNAVTAETKEFSVSYLDEDGKKRNYFPDFFVNGKIIEVKPKRLLETRRNKLKFAAARKAFENFVVLTDDDVSKPQVNQLRELINAGDVTLMEKYKKKMEIYKE